MTYIDLINDFWQEFESEALKPNDALLYLYLLKTCNSLGWKNPFELSNKKIRLCLEITDKVILESRDRLVKRGLIKVTKGERNRQTPTYKIMHFCFPSESKKGSKSGSKKGSKTEAKSQQNGSKTGYLTIDKDKDYFVVVGLTREAFISDFFKDERKITIEALCMNNYTDEATLRRLAEEVIDEWQATSEPVHPDINRAQKHLLNQIRIKLEIERKKANAAAAASAPKAAANRAADKAPRNVNESWQDFPTPPKQ